jgi:hypothetical protein
MSIKSFLTKIWASIKSLFDGMPGELKTAIHIGVIITENIKKFVDSPPVDVLTVLIPGDVDDKIKQLLRINIPTILTELKLADTCAGLTDPSEITACAINVLQDLDNNVQGAFLHNISIMLAQIVADGQLTWSDGVYLLEWYYQHQYKQAA